jgi:hypothetical protein
MSIRTSVTLALVFIVAIGMVEAVRPGIVKEISGATRAPLNATTDAISATQTTETPQLIGGQLDAHGCLSPAGFSWNETSGTCMRPFSGETQLATGTILVDMSDPNWRQHIVIPISTETKCVKTDGADIYTAGTLFRYEQNPRKDFCMRHRFLKEWYCDNKDNVLSKLIICKEGCRDGACLPETAL